MSTLRPRRDERWSGCGTTANRGQLRRWADPGQYRRRWVARADVERLVAERQASLARTMERTVPPAPAGAMTMVDAARTVGVAYSAISYWTRQGRLLVHTRSHPFTYIDEASVRALLLELCDGYDLTELMTYTEAAAELHVTIQAVRRPVYTGTFTPVGRKRRARLLRAEVSARANAQRF